MKKLTLIALTALSAAAHAESIVNIGDNVTATGGQSVAIGDNTVATEQFSVALGTNASATGDRALAIGDHSNASGETSLAIAGGTATAKNALAVQGVASAELTTAVGNTAVASAAYASAYGVQAKATGVASTALGDGAQAIERFATAVGVGAKAAHKNSAAVGAYSTTKEAVVVTEAQVGQLKYGNFATGGDSVLSVGAAGAERQIVNVSAGAITQTSTDAINGSQLYAVADKLNNVATSTARVLGGDAQVDADGNITMSDVGGTGENTVHDAIKKVAGDVAVNTQNIANNTADIAQNRKNYAQLAKHVDENIERLNTYVDNTNTRIDQTNANVDANTRYIDATNARIDQTNVAVDQAQKQADWAADEAVKHTSVVSGDKRVVVSKGTNTNGGVEYSVALNGVANQADLDKTNAQVSANAKEIAGVANTVNGHTNQLAEHNARITSNSHAVAQVKAGVEANSKRIDALGSKLHHTDRKLRAGIAGATAVASIPQAYKDGKVLVGAGVGGYRGEHAIAVGASAASDNGKHIIKVNLAVDSRGEINYGAGYGYQF